MRLRIDGRDRVLPDFLILGAEQSGSTALAQSLRHHPDIFIPSRELQFFSYAESAPAYVNMSHSGIVGKMEDYLSFFDAAPAGSTVGEKSVSYLYHETYRQAIANIQKYHPENQRLKIILLLANPIERAWAHYRVNRPLFERLPFNKALQAWEERKLQGWVPAYDYIGAGRCAAAVEAFLNNFSRVKIISDLALESEAKGTMAGLFSFLELKYASVPLPKKTPGFWRRLLPHPAMKKKDREYLREIFGDEIHRLQELLKWDFSPWLQDVE